MLGSILRSPCFSSFNPLIHLARKGSYCEYPHCTDETVEAQRPPPTSQDPTVGK